MKTKRFLAALLVLALAVLAGCGAGNKGGAADQDKGKLTLALVASQEADKLKDTVKPLTEFLAKELNMDVEATVTPTYLVAIEGMGSGSIDVGLIPAFSYVIAHERYGVEAVLKSVRDGSDVYHSQILVRKDSGIKSLEDLKGKKFAFTDVSSTAGYLWPAAYLADEKVSVEPNEYFSDVVYLGAHDKVARAVYNGDVAAGAMFADSRDRLEKDIPDIFDATEVLTLIERPIPNDTISVRKDLSDDIKQKVVAAFEKFAEDPQGKETIKAVYTWDGVKAATDADYDVVREVAAALGIDLKSAELK